MYAPVQTLHAIFHTQIVVGTSTSHAQSPQVLPMAVLPMPRASEERSEAVLDEGGHSTQ